MRKQEIDWPYFKFTLIVSGICLLLGGGLLYHSNDFLSRQTQRYNDVRAQRDYNEQQYIAAKEDALIIAEYHQRFRKLQAAGIATHEQRLDWAEVLRATAETAKIPSVRFQVMPQTGFNAPYLHTTDDIQVNASIMKLQLEMAHEGDVLRLFEDLNSDALGLYHVNTCTLLRAGEGVALHMERPNVSALCELKWFTIAVQSAQSQGDI